jgi:N-acetylmuramoyl-L-alanine amidase
MGYLSNTDDRKKLNSSSVQNKIADYIKDGIVSYASAEGWN